jgi:hypothetical protein
MKIRSLAGRWMGFLTGASVFLAGAFSACSQITNSNIQITITAPTNGSVFMVPTNIVIDALVHDPSNKVAAVAFTAALGGGGVTPPLGIFLGAVTNGVPVTAQEKLYALTWSNALVGTWVITAQALDSHGLVEAGSPPVTITNLPPPVPSVDVATPTNGATFKAPTNIQLIAGASEKGGAISNVQFFDGYFSLGVVSNGVVVDPPGSPGLTPGSLAFSLTWSNPAVGFHFLTAVAEDTHGQKTTSAKVTIFVGSNAPPVVRITSPPNNAVFRAPVDIALLAYANDLSGYVSSVQFFAGSNSLGFGVPVVSSEPPPPTNASPPAFQTNNFLLIWSNAPVGSNSITAVAIDNMGLAATSAPVKITVLPATTPPTNKPEVVSIVATDPVAIAGTNCWVWLGLNTNVPPTWSNWMSPAALWRWYTNCGPEDAIFTVCRIGATNSSLTVTYSIGGTASNGVDYAALPGEVTIPAGQMESMITIVPMDNQTNSATNASIKTVILSLALSTNNPTNYEIGFPPRAEAIILDGQEPHPFVTGTLLGDGSFHFNAEGPDGAWFRIDCSSNLVGWIPVCTNQVVNGSIDFADPDAPGSRLRYYRAVPLPAPPSN